MTVIFFADLVLLNGKVITVDDEDTIAEAVAIKDGKVLLVGASREVEKLVAENTKVIELDGRTVVPGFIDAHVHFDATAVFTKLAETYHIPPVRYVEVTCSINSLDEMLDKIKEKARETPNEKWIIGKGRLVQPYPTRWQLDQAAPEHPVMIHCSGHNQILNNIALEKSGITKDKPTQEELDRLAPGGRIWRNPETGEPTGLITECWDYIFPQSPWPYEKIKEAIKKECNEALRFGITTIHNFYGWSEIPRIFLELQRNGELPIRVHQSPCVYGNRKTVELDCLLNLGLETGFGDEWIKFGSAKMFVDTLGINEEGVWVEWNRITQKKLDEYVIKAHEAGIRVMMHSLTRGGHIAALEAVERALKKTPKKDHRHRIEHFGGIFWEQEYEKLKKLSVMAVPTPYSSYGWYGDDAWLEHAKPSDKAVFFKTMLNDGLRPPGNSDCVGTEPEALNPWWSIWCMVARETKSGNLICPEEGTTVLEAIRIYTMNSAYSIFEEDIKGSLEPGKLADMAVLNKDPLKVPVNKLKDIEVDMTIVNGKIAFSK